jgi:hypothetical protein
LDQADGSELHWLSQSLNPSKLKAIPISFYNSRDDNEPYFFKHDDLLHKISPITEYDYLGTMCFSVDKKDLPYQGKHKFEYYFCIRFYTEGTIIRFHVLAHPTGKMVQADEALFEIAEGSFDELLKEREPKDSMVPSTSNVSYIGNEQFANVADMIKASQPSRGFRGSSVFMSPSESTQPGGETESSYHIPAMNDRPEVSSNDPPSRSSMPPSPQILLQNGIRKGALENAVYSTSQEGPVERDVSHDAEDAALNRSNIPPPTISEVRHQDYYPSGQAGQDIDEIRVSTDDEVTADHDVSNDATPDSSTMQPPPVPEMRAEGKDLEILSVGNNLETGHAAHGKKRSSTINIETAKSKRMKASVDGIPLEVRRRKFLAVHEAAIQNSKAVLVSMPRDIVKDAATPFAIEMELRKKKAANAKAPATKSLTVCMICRPIKKMRHCTTKPCKPCEDKGVYCVVDNPDHTNPVLDLVVYGEPGMSAAKVYVERQGQSECHQEEVIAKKQHIAKHAGHNELVESDNEIDGEFDDETRTEDDDVTRFEEDEEVSGDDEALSSGGEVSVDNDE